MSRHRHMATIEIGGRRVGGGQPLFVIAEIGLNHGGSLARALSLVDAAAEAGAHAIKLQSLRANRLVAPSCPPPAHVSPGRGPTPARAVASLRDFFAEFELDESEHRAIAAHARSRGLAFMSTPFDEEMVGLLDEIGCDAYKIASGDLTHTRLIETAARTGRPLVLSTGMSELDEIAAAVASARAAGCRELALLHCVSAYPVPAGSENLLAIATLAERFDVPVGLSDHGTEPLSAVVALTLGASLYEKHVILDDGEEDIDAAVSATPGELAAIVRSSERARQAMGDGRKRCLPAEAVNRAASRRGLYATRDLASGAVVTEDDVVALRPETGINASRWNDLIGRRLSRDLRAGDAFVESDLLPGTSDVPPGKSNVLPGFSRARTTLSCIK